jgi:8-oxo-dGTP diphosphatase
MPKSDQGVHPERYQIIPRTLIFLTHADEVLLLKGAPNKRLWANRYNGVGGHIERGEDVLSAARRELFEETGLAGLPLWLCGTIVVNTGEGVGIGIFVFRGECSAQEMCPSDEGALEWIEKGRLNDLPLVEDLPLLLPRILEMRPGDAPFFALTDYDEQDRLRLRFAG